MQLSHEQIVNSTHHKEILLVLDHIRTPNNIGLLLRTAEAFGVRKVFVISDEFTEITHNIQRVCRSVEKNISIDFFNNTDECLKKIPPHFNIYSLEKTSNSESIYDTVLSFPAVIVCGNERKGVSEKILQTSKKHIHIPMYGTNTSMNVAVATGICLANIVHAHLESQ